MFYLAYRKKKVDVNSLSFTQKIKYLFHAFKPEFELRFVTSSNNASGLMYTYYIEDGKISSVWVPMAEWKLIKTPFVNVAKDTIEMLKKTDAKLSQENFIASIFTESLYNSFKIDAIDLIEIARNGYDTYTEFEQK